MADKYGRIDNRERLGQALMMLARLEIPSYDHVSRMSSTEVERVVRGVRLARLRGMQDERIAKVVGWTESDLAVFMKEHDDGTI